MQELGDSEILQTFRGSHVFIIGADGFLGQVLVEKLLRTCEVDKLYLLMKPEEDKTEQECLENFFVGKVSLFIVSLTLSCMFYPFPHLPSNPNSTFVPFLYKLSAFLDC